MHVLCHIQGLPLWPHPWNGKNRIFCVPLAPLLLCSTQLASFTLLCPTKKSITADHQNPACVIFELLIYFWSIVTKSYGLFCGGAFLCTPLKFHPGVITWCPSAELFRVGSQTSLYVWYLVQRLNLCDKYAKKKPPAHWWSPLVKHFWFDHLFNPITASSHNTKVQEEISVVASIRAFGKFS